MSSYQQALNTLREQHQFRALQPLPDCRLNFSSNDYLGLSQEPSLSAAFWAQYPTPPVLGATSARLLAGNHPEHIALETSLSEAYQRPALLFNSGYHANLGCLSALAQQHTLIIADKWVHASMIDGIRLSGAPFKRYTHNNIAQLERLLEQYAHQYQHILIATESLFSMDGDHAPLTQLVALKKRHPNILLYLDETHAIGVYGNEGLGLAEQQGYLNDIDILIGAFGKAYASYGGFCITSPTLHHYLINHARPFIFSTALPPLNAAWTHFLFQQRHQWQGKRQHLAHIAQHLRQAIAKRGIAMPSESHIIPYICGENAAAEALAAKLQQQGAYALPIRPPTVPAHTARVRFSLHANMSLADIDWLISLLPTAETTQKAT